jgi:hypothetical protein
VEGVHVEAEVVGGVEVETEIIGMVEVEAEVGIGIPEVAKAANKNRSVMKPTEAHQVNVTEGMAHHTQTGQEQAQEQKPVHLRCDSQRQRQRQPQTRPALSSLSPSCSPFWLFAAARMALWPLAEGS